MRVLDIWLKDHLDFDVKISCEPSEMPKYFDLPNNRYASVPKLHSSRYGFFGCDLANMIKTFRCAQNFHSNS